LDVVGVYSARHTDGEVETMDVETIAPRQLRETVKLTAPQAPPAEMKRQEYPPKDSPARRGTQPSR
jgi:hypothetical protein